MNVVPVGTKAADLTHCREDFPLLSRRIDGRPIAYLDSAATSLKPQIVIDAVSRFYCEYTSNVHRAVHALSEEATDAYEGARETIARFLNADAREIAFVRNATEAFNVVGHTLRDRGPVMMPLSEHHSNLLPWRLGEAVLLPNDDDGQVDIEQSTALIAKVKPVLVTFSTVSNGLGTRLPVEDLTAAAREAGAYVMLDASQSCGHEPVDVRALDCDFLCLSGHKMLGPSGVGVLYRREGLRDELEPILVGGSMVLQVHADSAEYQPYPWCIEGGTPNIEGVLGLAAACTYLDTIGVESIQAHCRRLTNAARSGLDKLHQVKVFGCGESASDAIVTFSLESLEAHGVARMLSNRFRVMVRSGYHCAQPIHEACGLPETVRASVHLYNTHDEIDALVEGVAQISRLA